MLVNIDRFLSDLEHLRDYKQMSAKEEKKRIDQVINGKGGKRVKQIVQNNTNLEEKISKENVSSFKNKNNICYI